MNDPIQLDYSTKNIPIPTHKDYLKAFISKTEKFIRNIRWRAFFFLNPDQKPELLETFGFNSTKSPPFINELKEFENGLLNIVKSIRFKSVNNALQNQMKNDIKDLKNSKDMLIPSDKTHNFYKLKPQRYEELMSKSLNKDYRKSNSEKQLKHHERDKKITDKLKLSDRVEITAPKEAFITLKDHKANFKDNPQCRLINPCKSNTGKISKQILERIITNTKYQTKLNLWKDSSETIQWFQNLQPKGNCKVITFDVCEFYPSISEELFLKALKFAKQFNAISKHEIEIVTNSKTNTLYHNSNPWEKINNDFDVTMGSFDGAETCEIVGLFLLNELKELNASFGLYRDDGIAVCYGSNRDCDQMKKKICSIFKKHNLKITVSANLTSIDFLDISLDFKNGTYQPYRKPNDSPLYVHRDSNHPPNVTKNIPKNTNQRLTRLSSNEEIFKKTIPIYEEALKKSGYNHTFLYQLPTNQTNQNMNTKSKNRSRNITWFNPPFSKNVATNVGKSFLSLLDRSFPKEHKLRKLMNRNNIKISYSCMPNVNQIISKHNRSIIENLKTPSTTDQKQLCNCRKKDQCPLKNKCLTESIVYKATIKYDNSPNKDEYIGSTENSFKTRFTEHKASIKNENKRHATTLSEHIWKLKEKNIPHTITWDIIEKAKAYRPGNTRCNLCITEKFFITFNEPSLNRRNELTSSCRHRRKYLLSNFRPSTTS